MKIGFLKEDPSVENRVVLIPPTAKKLIGLGFELILEKDFAVTCGYSDEEFKALGATIQSDRSSLLKNLDLLAKIIKPTIQEVDMLRQGAICISYLDPFNEMQLVHQLRDKKISAISVEMIPRTTLAQKMDFLSSQASLAGYVAVVLAAERLDKIFPMMMTPSGTISPSRVFIIGAGVAGLQAIATAKRLGARVDAFDTRPVVKEQVLSLGAKFVEVDLGETGQTKDGYAKQLTEEQLAKQREVMAQQCQLADVVITTAQLFGRKAPVIITEEMVAKMKPGSIIIDLAVESGGNVAGSVVGQEVDKKGVRIIGLPNIPGHVNIHASQMLAANMYNLIEHFTNKEQQTISLDLADEITAGCVIVHEGEIVNQQIANFYK